MKSAPAPVPLSQWRITRPLVVARGSAAPTIEWLPLARHVYATREDALAAATSLFAAPATEAALMALGHLVRLQRMERVERTFEDACQTRDDAFDALVSKVRAESAGGAVSGRRLVR
jgi:hypothetical protein